MLDDDDIEYGMHVLVDLKNTLGKVEEWLHKATLFDDRWTKLVVTRINLMNTIESMERVMGIRK